MQKLKLLTGMLILVCASVNLYAQGQEVKGQVVDAAGIPLIAVTVFEEGNTSTGTVTDFDGNYTITPSSAKAVLVFSCLAGLISMSF